MCDPKKRKPASAKRAQGPWDAEKVSQRAQRVDVLDLGSSCQRSSSPTDKRASHLLEGDVFALTELNEVLDAVNDLEPPDRIDGGDVAAVEPAFLVDRLLALGLVLVVCACS